ncbi:hypothetical protein NEF87_002468 [Candidatus Lokiarchaeum ossiferum]|uniref:Methyl-accepting chemotaxis protein n=1 Tax=Candidatus Lokiarchaeum ossiferum TaxID=2951803 RepID=A0ABY6HRP5_9ARCH|nr:hypothetical protein NEF87_002468 [Candidatus Lokiarchaeum sp. B-35]
MNKSVRISIRIKILAIGLVPIVLFSVATVLSTSIQTRSNMYLEKENNLKSMVDLAESSILQYYNYFTDGNITEIEAKNTAKEMIKNYRYGSDLLDYFWIQETIDNTPYMVMHPNSPHLDGTDISGNVDPNGKHLFVEMMQTCEETDKDGFVDYEWKYYSDENRIEPKKSYVRKLDAWGWIVGTGIYINDVDDIVQAQINTSILITVIVAILGTGLLVVSSNYVIVKPLKILSKGSTKVAEGNYTVQIETQSDDEFGDLSHSFSLMVTKIKEEMQIINGIIDKMPTPMAVINPRFEIERINNSLIRIFGLSQNEIIGKISYEVFQEKIQSQNETLIAQAVKTKKIIEDSYIFLNPKTNKKVYLDVYTFSLFNEGGDLQYSLQQFQDITAKKGFSSSVKVIAEEVNSMASQIADSTGQINISVQEITSGSQEVANGAQVQTQTLNDILSAVEQIQILSSEVVGKISHVVDLSRNGKEMARESERLTDNINEKMDDISKNASKVNMVMNELSEKSQAINKIVDVISGIATETNLLALNAAIEAARAGDAGKGFAVVAEQVRKLAEDSKQAADQINELIKIILDGISEAVGNTTATSQSVEAGITAIQETRSQLKSLFDVIVQTDVGITESASNIENEDTHIKDIAKNVEKINAVVEQNSSITEEVSSSTEEMAATLEELSAGAEELKAASDQLFNEVKNL